MKKVYTCLPIEGKEDEWHEITYGKNEPWKEANWEHFTGYSPNLY